MQEDDRRTGAGLNLGSRQRAAVAVALTILATLIIVCAALGLAWVAIAFTRRFSGVFLPLAFGAVAALVFRPYYVFLNRKLRFPAPLALVGVFLSVLLPVTAFAWFFGALAVDQLRDLIVRLPAWWERMVAQANAQWPEVQHFLADNPWGQRIRGALANQDQHVVEGLQLFGGKALSAGRGLLGSLASLLGWVVFPVYFAFFLMADPAIGPHLGRQLPFLKAETRDDVVYLITQFVDIVVAFFRGQLIIAFLQGALFAIGFGLVGLKYGVTLGLLLGFLNIIPYLGSMIGLGIGLPLGYLQDGGGLGVVAGILVVFAIVQMIEGYVLTPRIMGQRTGLHPMAIIVAIFFWGAALDGILGMILAIPLTAFLVVFWRLAREKYIGELV